MTVADLNLTTEKFACKLIHKKLKHFTVMLVIFMKSINFDNIPIHHFRNIEAKHVSNLNMGAKRAKFI